MVLPRFGGVRKINCYLSVACSRSKTILEKGLCTATDITVKNAVSLIFWCNKDTTKKWNTEE